MAQPKRRQWYVLFDEQKRPFRQAQWKKYSDDVSYQLDCSLSEMQADGRETGMVLDLTAFQAPPFNDYQVWRTRPARVLNPTVVQQMGNEHVVGHFVNLWHAEVSELPPAAAVCQVLRYFYQVKIADVEYLAQMEANLADASGPLWRGRDAVAGPPGQHWLGTPPAPRRRVVIALEQSTYMSADPRRFRPRSAASGAAAPAPAAPPPGVDDEIEGREAVWQWWYGDPDPGGYGHWKSYHSHVCARLEQALRSNAAFAAADAAVDVDPVRYCMRRITPEKPFDYLEHPDAESFREPFLPRSVVTVAHTRFDGAARVTNNCFIQFQRGNPKRRRPVRRVRRGEAAGVCVGDDAGDPCAVCFSDTGAHLTGCPAGHAVCVGCLRFSLRAAVGDSSKIDGLMCGCLTSHDRDALSQLAAHADEAVAKLTAQPPEEGTDEREEWDMDLGACRQQWSLGAGPLPPTLYRDKIAAYLTQLEHREMEGLYYACTHPGCGMQNWILRTDFDEMHRSKGEFSWKCGQGHDNAVLPSADEINEMNRNLLAHPEHYTGSCEYNRTALRRFRLCPQCITEGALVLAVHGGECKQWPGYGRGHKHTFCFRCTGKWDVECGHGRDDCRDPGLQQVRRVREGGTEVLQLGHIDSQQYIRWLEGRAAEAPRTAYPSGQSERGPERQRRLRMEDKAELLEEMRKGTQ